MKRILSGIFAAIILLCNVGTATAHEDFRVIGTLTNHENSLIQVESRTGNSVSIRLDQQTLITKDQQVVDADALVAGISVVVDAYGDTEEDLLALEIRIVPPIEN